MAKTWLITGTSSGFGAVLTARLLKRGDRVLATTRRSETLAELASQYPQTLRVLSLDLADSEALLRTVDDAFASETRIDVVVSNAAYGLFGAAEELSDAQIDRQIAINLTASIQLIRAALPHLRAQGGGRIVQFSSEGGQIAYPGFSLYHATKWGIEGFVEAVAQEVAGFGIAFLLVEPGPTQTGFRAALEQAPELEAYRGTPAQTVRDAIDSGSFVINGDVQKGTDAIIATVDGTEMPLRLALGSTAYNNIARELESRRAALEAQKAIALHADRDAPSR
ncbi:SDR family oxidoreductase [Asaia sp. BMEF1]|uniref:SDR family oxidoreductase n=1 Tax=Asaia sp. BMEF1 TaxID=3155932 RepID=UPI003F6715F2